MAGHMAHLNQYRTDSYKKKNIYIPIGGEKFPKPKSDNYLSDLHKKNTVLY